MLRAASSPVMPTIRPATGRRRSRLREGLPQVEGVRVDPRGARAAHRADIASGWRESAIPTMDVWVADLDGVVVGQMMVRPTTGLVCTTSTSTRHGWVKGSAISSWHSLANAIPTGLQLWAFQSNERARRFYERHGFVAVELTDGSGQ